MSAYVNTFEWYFTQQGMQKGIKQGIEQGIEKGKQILLQSLLVRRFGELPGWVNARLADADAGALESWSLRVLDAKRIEDVFT